MSETTPSSVVCKPQMFAAWNGGRGRRVRLPDLLRRLDAYAGAVPAALLAEELARLRVFRDDVQPFLRFERSDYQRVLLRRCPHYEALLLCWLPEQLSPIHDHGDSSCVVGVLSGEAVELNFAWNADRTLTIDRWQRLPAGSTTASIGRDVHQVANWSRTLAPLITLHIYSPPLAGVSTYRRTQVVPAPAARLAARSAVRLEGCA